eukprot:m.118732 g.118732  ORF g.118732 m.118732 type:complete len:199 (+) comp9242_c0_seq1:279-875(+)
MLRVPGAAPVVLLALVGALSKLAFKVALEGMGPFAIVVTMLNAFTFVPVFALASILFTSPLREARKVPRTTVVAIAALECATMLLHGFPSGHIPAPVLTLLSQSKVPFSMALSRLTRGTQYAIHHYIGAATVIGGICVASLAGCVCVRHLLNEWHISAADHATHRAHPRCRSCCSPSMRQSASHHTWRHMSVTCTTPD